MALYSVVETDEATFTRLHGVTFQKTDIFTVTAMKISKQKISSFNLCKNFRNIFGLLTVIYCTRELSGGGATQIG
jgi:hypothetical protein